MAAIHLAAHSFNSSPPADPSFSASARPLLPSARLAPAAFSFLSCSKLAGGRAAGPLHPIPARRRPVTGRRVAKYSSGAVCSAVRKLSEAELLPVPAEPEGLDGKFPAGAGVYGVYDGKGELQFIGISRNVAASVATHRKALPELCHAVK